MKEARLLFPVGAYSLNAPDEILEIAGILYPHSLELPATAGGPAAARGSLRVAPRGDRWRLEQDGAVLGEYDRPLQAALALEYAVEASVVRDRGDWVALHAGAVGVDGGALLLAGDPDRGKTSCTFQLVELGHPFLAEEVALVDAESALVHPYLQTLSLDGELVERHRQARPTTRGRMIRLEPGHYRYLPAIVAAGPLPLRTILLPRYLPGATGRVETVPPEAALTELLGYCFEPRGEDESFFDRLIRLVTATRILRLTYRSAREARELLQRLTAPSADAEAEAAPAAPAGPGIRVGPRSRTRGPRRTPR